MSFHLIDTNDSHLKAEEQRFAAAGSYCRHSLKFENFTSSFGRLQGA